MSPSAETCSDGAPHLEQADGSDLWAQRVVAAGDQAREHGLHPLDGRLRLVVPRRPEPVQKHHCPGSHWWQPDGHVPTRILPGGLRVQMLSVDRRVRLTMS